MRRYERQHPGELIHIDIKKLGRFHQVGHRITGDRRRQSNARSRGEGAGWEFVHVCIDDASRIAFTMIMPNEKAKSAIAFLKAAVAYYNSLGVTVAGVMTDNGSCYKAFAFDRACKRLKLKHIRTRPYTPKTNGKAERFIQTALREWAYAKPYNTSNERAQQLQPWTHAYNWHRPHGSLKANTPISRLGLSAAMDGVLYLTGRDIAALGVSPGRLRAALARAFRLHAEGRTHVEPKLTVAIAPGHFFQSLCAASPDLSFAATKWVGVAAENAARGLAGVNGLVILSDFATGVPAAILDGNVLTVVRTAAMSALAAEYLARHDSESIGFVGCGAQAHGHLAALREILPALRRVVCYRARFGLGRSAGRSGRRPGPRCAHRAHAR